MSILIKDMEMPQKCGQCKLFHAEHPMHCMAVEGHRTVGAPYGMSRPDWCPLVEIPTPHSDLVDRNKLLAEYDRQHKGPAGGARRIMEQADAVIEAEGSET
jgi:hypothetical protein